MVPPKLAWLGLGSMGKSSEPVLIWNRSIAKAHALAEALPGLVTVASSIGDAVRGADIIGMCLLDGDAVSDTLNVALKEDVSGKLFVDCTTVKSEAANEFAERMIAAGAEFVHMPVFGKPPMAEAGILTCVPAGKKESVAKLKPYLVGVLAKDIIDYSGEKCGQAALLKIIGNVFLVHMIQALAEGHVLAQNTGLGSENLEKFISVVFGAQYMVHSKQMTTGAYYKKPPDVSISAAKTVASHVMELAEKSGTKLPAYETMVGLWDRLEQESNGEADIDGVVGVIKVMSGGKFGD